jgi:hypothetical protein
MTQTGSTEFTVVGWAVTAAGVGCGLWITWDIVIAGHPQRMAIMNAVWPLTALYLGPLAVLAYARREQLDAATPDWWPTAKGVSHCGAGCTLGDIVGEWLVYLTAWSIPLFGVDDADTLMAMYVASFTLAWLFGVAFQHFSIVPMRDDLGPVAGIWAAIKADTLSIVAFQGGLFGVMALVHLVIWQPPLGVASPGYWTMMQVGMAVGFVTAWPVNGWLVRNRWKEKM